MARRPSEDVTDTELAILHVIWNEGRATRRQITDVLYPQGGEAFSSRRCRNLLAGRLRHQGFVSAHTRSGGRADLHDEGWS